MYSGRITETGIVIETGSRLVIEAPKTAAGLSPGGSVNVNGTCVSAVQADGAAGRFEAEISAETANRSTLGELAPGARVNLELPLRVGDALDGHLVQGHTDAIGKVTKVDAERGGSLRVWIRPPKRFLDEIVAKGSVAVDGVSLTVAEVLTDRFSVALIPLTLAATTLAALHPEQRVNLESDLFVKSARGCGSRLTWGQPFPVRAAVGRGADRAGRRGQVRRSPGGRGRGADLRSGPGGRSRRGVRRRAAAARVDGVPAHPGLRAYHRPVRPRAPRPPRDRADAGRGRPARHRVPRPGRPRRRHGDRRVGA